MAEPPSAPEPLCWDLLGHRRQAWSNENAARDCFGFLVDEGIPIFMNAFGDDNLVRVHVDYPHGLHFGPQTRVQYVPAIELDDDYADDTTYLCDVCTVRAVKHFASQWLRYTKRSIRRKALGCLLARLSLPDPTYTAIINYVV